MSVIKSEDVDWFSPRPLQHHAQASTARLLRQTVRDTLCASNVSLRMSGKICGDR